MAQVLHISDIQLFNVLKGKLGEKEAEALVGFVKTEVEENIEKKYEHFDEKTSQLASKIKEDFSALRVDINKNTADLKNELRNEIFSLKDNLYKNFGTKEDIAKLETNVAKKESRLILWAFIFWATQLGAMFAFLKAFIK